MSVIRRRRGENRWTAHTKPYVSQAKRMHACCVRYNPPQSAHRPLCGAAAPSRLMTFDDAAVTCLRCLATLARRKAAREAAARAEEMRS